MGKNKRSDKLKGAGDKRHKGANLEVTLREDLAKASGVVQPSAPRAAKQRARAGSDEDLDEKQTASIQEMAKAQRGEEARREADDLAERASRVAFDVEEVSDDDDDDDYLDGDEGDDVDESAFDIGSEALSASQAALVDSFMAPKPGARRTLADVIMEKIAEKEAGAGAMDDDVEDNTLPERVVEAYSGMIPLLGATAATKVFASNLDPKRARVFYNEVLLERCRDDITVNKKLNYHLYQALHKALFKPAPWFKGILLPLVQDRDCTLREALIFGSVLAKASVPAAHAAVVLLKLADMAYSGAQSVFLIVLLNKKRATRRRRRRRREELPQAHKHHEIRRELVAGHKSRH
ncbi:hypothetical protein JL720_12132 [Aureococcus anophagefferens]|nr:hypothetical protein JL720_12132 [Aureococcus anophagefferens]